MFRQIITLLYLGLFTISLISGCANTTTEKASKCTSKITAGNSSSKPENKPNAATHMPNQESGMRYIYDGAKNLIKITNADSSLYYFPGDTTTPTEYQGGTWFVIDPAVNSTQKKVSFNIDTKNGMKNAEIWINKYVSTKNQQNIIKSLYNQKGTKCTIYYEGHITN